MLTDHAAGIAPGGAGLAAEARRVGDELQRQLLGIENLAGHDVGQRHFCGRDQVEVCLAFAADLEQIVLEFRQLTGALQRRRLHQVGGIGLFVAMLTGVQIDHELRQGAMQAGDRPTHQGEAGAGQFGGGLEIQPTVLLAQGDMILHREVEGLRRAPAANLDVLFLVRTDRHGLVRQVGDAQHQLVQLTLDAVQLLLAGFEFAAHAIHIGEQRGDVLTALLGLADGLGTRIALGLELFGAGLHGLALGLQRFDARHVQLVATGGQAGRHVL